MVDDVAWDATAWLDELKVALKIAGDGYMRRVGADDDAEEIGHLPGVRSNRSSFAMLAVGTVMNKLAEAPGMRGHIGLVPLHDLTAALWDLGRGGQPPLLQPVAGVGKGGELSSKRWIREHALLSIAVLEAAGTTADAAGKHVAQALAKAGHCGRKKVDGVLQPLSHKTLSGWRTESRQANFAKQDPVTAAFLDRALSRLRQLPDWPFTPEQAADWVQDFAGSPLARAKV